MSLEAVLDAVWLDNRILRPPRPQYGQKPTATLQRADLNRTPVIVADLIATLEGGPHPPFEEPPMPFIQPPPVFDNAHFTSPHAALINAQHQVQALETWTTLRQAVLTAHAHSTKVSRDAYVRECEESRRLTEGQKKVIQFWSKIYAVTGTGIPELRYLLPYTGTGFDAGAKRCKEASLGSALKMVYEGE